MSVNPALPKPEPNHSATPLKSKRYTCSPEQSLHLPIAIFLAPYRLCKSKSKHPAHWLPRCSVSYRNRLQIPAQIALLHCPKYTNPLLKTAEIVAEKQLHKVGLFYVN